MASVNCRSGKLYLDFRFDGKRYRQQTSLEDTKPNRKRLEKALSEIERLIKKGVFNPDEYFGVITGSSANQNTHVSQVEVGLNSHGQKLHTPTLKQFYDQWLAEMSPMWRKTYIDSINSSFNGHVFPYFTERIEVGDITKEQIYGFRAHLAKGQPEKDRKPSPSTVNRTLKLLRMMLNEAADRYNFRTPFTGVKLLKERKTHIEPFTLEEIQLILKHVRKDMRAYFLIRFFTGMRSGEVNGLKWEYVDFENRQILIRETFVNGLTEYTKNDGSQREIDMSDQVFQALQEQQAVSGHCDYVFCTREGGALDNHNIVNRIWKPLLRYVELPYRRPYTMRHTAATLWLAAGENPEWIARQMGHASTEMLFKVYSRYVPNCNPPLKSE